jgi:3-oxoacyl-[acyl-carrier protein] reductase
MSTQRFSGRHVLVTGGARGIGLAVAEAFAREGARLTLFDVHAANLRAARAAAASGFSADVAAAVVDVSDRARVIAAVDAAEARAPIDVLVSNAGIAEEAGFLDVTEEAWKRILDVNLTGMFHVDQAVCRHMARRRRGVVLNMASKNGLDGESGYAHYNASKGGVVMLTKTMALELAHVGIRVNAVAPGYLQTPMSREIDSPEFVRDFVERYIPLDRPGAVEDVTGLFLFLASDEASWITGQVYVIDGGQLAGQKPGRVLRERLGPKA